ncbi:MAG: NADH-quinone oxidoreductase subunit A [Deltaproteobacteria bacterium]|nr:NADH-quinone oxidoreductase subunit A [Deltaproteobacteria bacterium]
MDYVVVFFVFCLAFVFVFGGLFVSHILAPQKPNAIKNSPYECGEKTIGSSWIPFNVGYYLFALLFLVFDVEAAFLYPWACVFRELGWSGFIEVSLFAFILLAALIYAWKKGVLEWV